MAEENHPNELAARYDKLYSNEALDAGHVHYFTFRQVKILYEIAGFKPEIRLGVGRRFAPLRNWWPTLPSELVCVSGTFQDAPVN